MHRTLNCRRNSSVPGCRVATHAGTVLTWVNEICTFNPYKTDMTLTLNLAPGRACAAD
jgi:hypothetical protein